MSNSSSNDFFTKPNKLTTGEALTIIVSVASVLFLAGPDKLTEWAIFIKAAWPKLLAFAVFTVSVFSLWINWRSRVIESWWQAIRYTSSEAFISRQAQIAAREVYGVLVGEPEPDDEDPQP